MTTASETIVVESHGPVRVVRINRPERAGALDPPTARALGQAMLDAEVDDSVRVVILTGTGDRSFCSGMDLKAFAEARAAGDTAYSSDRAENAPPGPDVLTERFFNKPTIAAVNGAARGGGFGLMLACDMCVAADHATFGTPEVKHGLVGVGVTSRAALRLPPAIALEMALTGEPIDAATALMHGIINRVVPGDEVMPTALKMAALVAEHPPLAVQVTKDVVYEAARLVTGVNIPELRKKAAPLFAGKDAAAGAQAFVEKKRTQ
jgi:enoyl-CoA hydratase